MIKPQLHIFIDFHGLVEAISQTQILRRRQQIASDFLDSTTERRHYVYTIHYNIST
jgi:hypothetical protein